MLPLCVILDRCARLTGLAAGGSSLFLEQHLHRVTSGSLTGHLALSCEVRLLLWACLKSLSSQGASGGNRLRGYIFASFSALSDFGSPSTA